MTAHIACCSGRAAALQSRWPAQRRSLAGLHGRLSCTLSRPSRRNSSHTGLASAASSNGASPPGDGQWRAQQRPAAVPPYDAWPATARVALRTGAYITLLGLAIFLLPASVFGAVFDASRVTLGWVRVGGVLAALFGAYYVGAGLDDAAGREPRCFYASTIAGRLLLSAAFCWLVASRQCEAGLLVLAAANAASSGLLWRAIRQRRRDETRAAMQRAD